MGKGKKKSKGMKWWGGINNWDRIMEVGLGKQTKKQKERAIVAACNRKEDPLKNWEHPQQDECPICMLILPPDESECLHCSCCGKIICCGCIISTFMAVHERDGVDVNKAVTKARVCPFCREEHGKNISDFLMKQAQDGHHDAMYRVGRYSFNGENGLKMNKTEGMKWLQRAVEAGSGKAVYYIGSLYIKGELVDRGSKKALGCLRKGAELGDIPSFYLIGFLLMKKGEIEEGMLNLRKAAISGISDQLLFSQLKLGFSEGFITKEEYAFTLRKNQAICNELNSQGRQTFRCFSAVKHS